MKPIPLMITVATLLACSLPTLAQTAPARITLLSGQVDMRSNGKAASHGAQMNAPVAAHNIISTRPRAQTEIQIGSTVVRLDAESELEISQIDAKHVSLNLHYGSAFFNVQDSSIVPQFEVRTTQGRLSLLEPGQVRVDAGTQPDATAIRLFSGSARFAGADGNQINLQSGTQVALRGRDVSTTPLMQDEFDDWNLGASGGRSGPSGITAAPRYDTRGETRYEPVTQAPRETITYYSEPAYISDQYPGQIVYNNVRTEYYPGWGYAPLYLGAWLWLNNAWYWDRGWGGHYYHPGYRPGYSNHATGGSWTHGSSHTGSVPGTGSGHGRHR